MWGPLSEAGQPRHAIMGYQTISDRLKIDCGVRGEVV